MRLSTCFAINLICLRIKINIEYEEYLGVLIGFPSSIPLNKARQIGLWLKNECEIENRAKDRLMSGPWIIIDKKLIEVTSQILQSRNKDKMMVEENKDEVRLSIR